MAEHEERTDSSGGADEHSSRALGGSGWGIFFIDNMRYPPAIACCGLAIFLIFAFVKGPKRVFLPGATSNGHHVFEEACSSCHTGFQAVSNDKCNACHRHPDDTHAVEIFDDPRWATNPDGIRAAKCVSCHGEHRITANGVTAGSDACIRCHDDIPATRPSHNGFTGVTCGTAGCHNYHDNSVLNASFLKKHLHEPDLLPGGRVPSLPALERSSVSPPRPDNPSMLLADSAVVARWQKSAHAARDVNCRKCHEDAQGQAVQRPDDRACSSCHRSEARTFGAGTHGVRRSAGLDPLRPALARIHMTEPGPARPDALRCTTCHDPHSEDTHEAATKACLSCHADGHSRAFEQSKHALTLTCATCHLPRIPPDTGSGHVAVNHDNTFTAAPRDRMVKTVCLGCHGLEFALTSILDDRLVSNNFQGTSRKPRLRTFTMIEAERGGS